MPGPANYPSGFSEGLTLRGMPIRQTHPGEVFYVNNSSVLPKGGIAGSNVNNGSYKKPFATWTYALSMCLANRGDIIFVMPGHAESVTAAAGVILNKAGVATIGIGIGALRPTITFTTAATASITVTAAQTSIRNILFIANFADVATCFDVSTAKDFTIDTCEFRDTDSTHNFLTIVTTDSTANRVDGLFFGSNNVFGTGTTAATTPIKIGANVDRLTVTDNLVNLAVLNNTSALVAKTSKVATNLVIARNTVFRPNTDTATGGLFLTTTSTTDTGWLKDNVGFHADVAAAIVATTSTGLGFSNNLMCGDADASAFVLPAIGAN